MNPIELYDVFTLEDDKDYTVANMAVYQDAEYLYLIEVDNDDNLKEDNQKIVKRVVKNGEDSVEIVTNKEELNAVAKIFFELFSKDANEAVS